MRIGPSRSFKVVDFGTNRKGICDFLLVIYSNFAPFLRDGDLLAENCEYFLPYSHLTPSLGVNPFEFLYELFNPKTRVLGLSVGKDFRFRDPSLRRFDSVLAYDGRTDRRTDTPRL